MVVSGYLSQDQQAQLRLQQKNAAVALQEGRQLLQLVSTVRAQISELNSRTRISQLLSEISGCQKELAALEGILEFQTSNLVPIDELPAALAMVASANAASSRPTGPDRLQARLLPEHQQRQLQADVESLRIQIFQLQDQVAEANQHKLDIQLSEQDAALLHTVIGQVA
ncbi:hypothetical protein [Thiomonas sp.]